MSLNDPINVTFESEEIKIQYVDNKSNVKVSLGSLPDVITSISTDELGIKVETKEIKLNIDDEIPDIGLTLDTLPDVIVLPTTGLTGPPGPAGPQGPQGPPGPSGIGTQITYIFVQIATNTVWDIIHNLNRYPSVTVVDTGGSEIIPNVVYINSNKITLYFENPTSGKAYLN